MKYKFLNKKITGILTILPENEVDFDDEIDNYSFPRGQSLKLKLVMGYNKRRIANSATTSSDLCIFGMNYLFEKGYLKRDEISALVLVTQTPDHFMPPTSAIIHGKLGLDQKVVCFDINQGCSGYIIGLNQAFMLLEQDETQKVVLLNADVLSHKVSIKDRGNRPNIGDGASITIVEKGSVNDAIFSSIQFDGKGADVLQIPAGGLKMPSTPETAELIQDESGNYRSLDHVWMKGDEVFNFVQREVPPMIEELLETAGKTKDEIDYYMFHQPNRFMLQKLADKLEIAYDRMPNNIVENFGNSSSVTIPANITFNLGERLLDSSLSICMAGFGVGLSWSSLIIELENLTFCEMVNYK